MLRVIHGGRSPRKEKIHDPFALLLYLFMFAAWRRSRPRPFPEEPGSGVHPKARRKVVGPTVAELRVKTRQLLMLESGSMGLRVLNQYVRCAMGFPNGLEEYLKRAAQEQVRRLNRARIPGNFLKAWEEELRLLLVQARGFVATAKDTGERTRKGYFILRGIGARGRCVFLTIHDQQNSVVGIYTGARFNRKRANRRWRAESHQRAMAFRRDKARLTPR